MAVTIYIKGGGMASKDTIKIKEGAGVDLSDAGQGLIRIIHANGSLLGVASVANVLGWSQTSPARRGSGCVPRPRCAAPAIETRFYEHSLRASPARPRPRPAPPRRR